MSIKVLFFASLREQVGHSQRLCPWQTDLTPNQVWQQITQTQLPEHLLMARNQEYCDENTPLADGDELAFFPPVTGG